MEKKQRTYIGKVVSDKMDKTITVLVETKKKHKMYSKLVKSSKKFKAHDESEVAEMGDMVEIIESRPLSATKTCNLLRVIEKAKK